MAFCPYRSSGSLVEWKRRAAHTAVRRTLLCSRSSTACLFMFRVSAGSEEQGTGVPAIVIPKRISPNQPTCVVRRHSPHSTLRACSCTMLSLTLIQSRTTHALLLSMRGCYCRCGISTHTAFLGARTARGTGPTLLLVGAGRVDLTLFPFSARVLVPMAAVARNTLNGKSVHKLAMRDRDHGRQRPRPGRSMPQFILACAAHAW